MHPCDATLVLGAVFIQFLSRRRISNMFDIKDKSSATNRLVVTQQTHYVYTTLYEGNGLVTLGITFY